MHTHRLRAAGGRRHRSRSGDEDADKLAERISRHVDKACTVKHTYVQETPVRMNVTVKH